MSESPTSEAEPDDGLDLVGYFLFGTVALVTALLAFAGGVLFTDFTVAFYVSDPILVVLSGLFLWLCGLVTVLWLSNNLGRWGET